MYGTFWSNFWRVCFFATLVFLGESGDADLVVFDRFLGESGEVDLVIFERYFINDDVKWYLILH